MPNENPGTLEAAQGGKRLSWPEALRNDRLGGWGCGRPMRLACAVAPADDCAGAQVLLAPLHQAGGSRLRPPDAATDAIDRLRCDPTKPRPLHPNPRGVLLGQWGGGLGGGLMAIRGGWAGGWWVVLKGHRPWLMDIADGDVRHR